MFKTLIKRYSFVEVGNDDQTWDNMELTQEALVIIQQVLILIIIVLVTYFFSLLYPTS